MSFDYLFDVAYSKSGMFSEQMLAHDPYYFADVADWARLDEYGKACGYGSRSKQRLGGALLRCISDAMNDYGHTALIRENVEARARILLQQTADWNGVWNYLEDERSVTFIDGLVQVAGIAHYEHCLALGVKRLSRVKREAPSIDNLQSRFDNLTFKASKQQVEAAMTAATYGISLITGGPATGKSSALRLVGEVASDLGLNVVFSAPNSMSAKRLAATTGFDAVSTPSLLGALPCGGFSADNITADIVIVDDAHLLDTWVATVLVDRLLPTCRVVMAGDVSRLPSLGPGAVFRDLSESGLCPVTELTESFRYAETTSILGFGRSLLNGSAPELPDYANNTQAIVSILEAGTHEAIENSVLDLYAKGFQILTIRQSGKYGADDLSERINLKGLNRDCNFVIGDQVCVRRGTYHLSGYRIASGIAGTVVGCNGLAGDKMLTVNFGLREAEFHQRMWDRLAYAWASTVHAAQGSEWLDTAVVLHQSAGRNLNRQVLCSAATCASRSFVLIGDRRNYTSAATSAGSRRHTGLSKWLQRSNNYCSY